MQSVLVVTEPRLLLQVVISLTLIFATVPLVHFTSDKAKMGEFVNGRIVTVRHRVVVMHIRSAVHGPSTPARAQRCSTFLEKAYAEKAYGCGLEWAQCSEIHCAACASREGAHSRNSENSESFCAWLMQVIAWLLSLMIGGLNTYLVIDAIRTNQFGATVSV